MSTEKNFERNKANNPKVFTKASFLLFKLQNSYLKMLLEELSLYRMKDESYYRKYILKKVLESYFESTRKGFYDLSTYSLLNKK